MSYDHSVLERFCKDHDLVLAEADLKEFDKTAEKIELTQKQYDEVTTEYAWRIKYYFNPKTYTFWSRVKIAFYFLTGFKGF